MVANGATVNGITEMEASQNTQADKTDWGKMLTKK